MKLSLKILMMAFILASCSRTLTLNTQEIESITLDDFEKKGDYYSKVLTEDKKPLIIKIPKDKKIPIDIQMDIAYADFSVSGNSMSFKSDAYLYLSFKGIYISPDSKNWAPIYDLKAINELYGQKSGSMALSFGARKEKGAFAKIEVHTYAK